MLEFNRLKQLRLESGLTLQELAVKAGLNSSTVSMIENGHRKGQMVTIHKLAKALEVSVNELAELLDTTAPERGKKGMTVRQGKPEAA
jgi:transcriptional regulator with XRE-family HTH domain